MSEYRKCATCGAIVGKEDECHHDELFECIECGKRTVRPRLCVNCHVRKLS